MSNPEIARTDPVRVFAALGERHRLVLVDRLRNGAALSIAELSSGLPLTRQAVTKHLDVLRRAGLVRSQRTGRENRFRLTPGPVHDARLYLARVAGDWDEALKRLKHRVEGS